MAYQNAILFEEFVNTRPIPPADIREARAYRLVNGLAVEVPGSEVSNPLYVDVPGAPNTEPLPADVFPAPSLRERARAALGGVTESMMSACWCERPEPGAASRSVETDPGLLCLAGVKHFNAAVPKATYLPVDAWRVDP
ncbi:MAG: hypothetical protein EON54_22035 [Alcaligenaceae bacterium]|nr:MAG: hypothetical protein EON54_22035 [Alcaligenaceae bacterium]